MNKKVKLARKILTPVSRAMMFTFTLAFGVITVGATLANANENEVTSFLGGGGNNIVYVDDGTVSNNQAKDVFAKMWDEPALAAAQAAKLLGFEKADSSFLDGIVREVISANPDKVAEIQGGNEKLLNWLTGQVMKAAKGKANPKIVTEALKKALSME